MDHRGAKFEKKFNAKATKKGMPIIGIEPITSSWPLGTSDALYR
jgi:hypothetical protein